MVAHVLMRWLQEEGGGGPHYLPAKGGDESTASAVIQLASPKADPLLLLSTQVKIMRLIAVMPMPTPAPKDKLNKTKRE